MSEKTEHTESQRGHETRDANFKSVVVSGAGLLGLMVVGLIVSFFVLLLYKNGTEQPGAHPGTFVEPSQQALPPAPRLQPDPHAHLMEMRASEDSILTTYGTIGRDSQFVRIPVRRAMEMLVKKGLPVRSAR